MNKFKRFVTAIFAIAIGFGIGFVGWGYSTFPTEFGDVYVSGNLQIHFIELGSEKSGDCTLIKVGNTEVLIDAGSEKDTLDDIDNYLGDSLPQELKTKNAILRTVLKIYSNKEER